MKTFAMLHTHHTLREWWAVAIELSFKYPDLTRGTAFGSRSHLHSHVAIVTLWFVGGYYAYIKYVRRGQSSQGIVWRALIPSKKFNSFALLIYCSSSFKVMPYFWTMDNNWVKYYRESSSGLEIWPGHELWLCVQCDLGDKYYPYLSKKKKL